MAGQCSVLQIYLQTPIRHGGTLSGAAGFIAKRRGGSGTALSPAVNWCFTICLKTQGFNKTDFSKMLFSLFFRCGETADVSGKTAKSLTGFPAHCAPE
jgi:hypothetical protein